jgi:hypothetical protein
MKKLLLLSSLLLSLSVMGQNLYPLQVEVDSFVFKIKVSNQQLILEQQGESTLFRTKKDFPTIEKVSLEEADLVLQYRAKKGSDLLSYRVAMTLKMPDGTEISPFQDQFSDSPEQQGSRKLVWRDATEFLSDMESSYTLKVSRSLMGAVNCEGARPKLSAQTKTITYLGASVGVMSLVISKIYWDDKKTAYNNYQQLWVDGASEPDVANSPFEKAKLSDRNAKIFFWSGVGVIAGSALYYTLKSRKNKQKQRNYDKFCAPEPKTSLQITPSKNGVGLVWHF